MAALIIFAAMLSVFVLPVFSAAQTLEVQETISPDAISFDPAEQTGYHLQVIRLVRSGDGETARRMAREVPLESRLRNQIVFALLEELSVQGDIAGFVSVLAENTGVESVRDLLLENVYLKFFLEPLWMLDLPGVFLRKQAGDMLIEAEQLSAARPDDPQAHFLVGFLRRQIGALEESLPALESSIRLDPLSAAGYFFKSLSLIELGQFEEALEAAEEAVRLDPGNEHFTALVPSLQLTSWNLPAAERSFTEENNALGLVLVAMVRADVSQFIRLLKGDYGAAAKRIALATVFFLGMIPLLLAVGYLLSARRKRRAAGDVFRTWTSLFILTALLLGVTTVVFISISMALYHTPFAFVFPKIRMKLFLISYIVSAIIWPLLVFRLARNSSRENGGLFRLHGGHLALGVAVGAALFGVNWLLDSTVVPQLKEHIPDVLVNTRVEAQIIRSLKGTPDFLLLLAAVVLAAPVLEETFFRATLQGTIDRAFGPAVAVLLSSGIFAVVHMRALLQLFIMGLVLAACYWKTRNLAVPVVAHAVSNAITLAAVFSSTSVF